MGKAKIYYITGSIIVACSIMGPLMRICHPENFQHFMANPRAEILPALYGIPAVFAFNMFNIVLWVGLIMLWRSDRNENPNKPSTWGKVIIAYLIFEIIMFFLTEYLIKTPNVGKIFNIDRSLFGF